MGRIEQYWSDITVYVVEFTSSVKESQIRRNRKTLVFHSYVTKDEVYQLIPNYLANVVEVLYVDILEDGLYLKEQTTTDRKEKLPVVP
ncbi:hypothetical protein [Enterococcus sp. 5H]|uniref:hypothetical protein n=1 Tax=Enterococcus sp. 5H TaxID=1229490 RepID=UPI002302A6C3|nr:hypothetical protein [Enterococcus sp. 5H]MDA9470512.1 hypothetical protein [Enterococcus sp. 5H]